MNKIATQEDIDKATRYVNMVDTLRDNDTYLQRSLQNLFPNIATEVFSQRNVMCTVFMIWRDRMIEIRKAYADVSGYNELSSQDKAHSRATAIGRKKRVRKVVKEQG